MRGQVWLVGAGCGGRELLTLAALDCIRRAEALVYDDLVDGGILDLAPPGAALYDVGKRGGRPNPSQDGINRLLLRLAGEGKRVCRLKGGDPFVFGRGGEEAAALKEAGVPFRVVPGISSCIAVPELVGIPVTHRGTSQLFHVVTGHTAEGGLPAGLEALAGSGGTIVVLMGLARAGEIAARLMELGMDPATPAALAGADVLRTTLAGLGEAAVGFPPPAVLVIGPAAALELGDESLLPLKGAVVGLTGTPRFQSRVEGALVPLGSRLRRVQAGRLLPACSPGELAAWLEEPWDWMAFTSPNGVDWFFRLCRLAGLDVRRLAGVRLAAVGPGTGEALWEHGLRADLIPDTHTTAALGEALAPLSAGKRVLLPAAEEAGREPGDSLARAGALCRRLPLYRVERGPVRPGPVDYLVFGSAGGVEGYLRAGGSLEGRRAVCIGPETARAAARAGGALLVAGEISVQGIGEAILRDWTGRARR